jgi:RHS repeat-associated protein
VYDYDGEGRRVRHQHQTWNGSAFVTASYTLYVYDAFGKLAAEYGAEKTNADCTTCYFTTDALGSTRLVTDQNGNAKARFDYLPFGQELGTLNGRANVLCGAASCYSQTGASTQKFTGKERDAETGLDYFLARYNAAAQGRFTSPDPLLNSGRPSDPQSWNRYAYASNNPLRYTDPTGLYTWDDSGCEANDDDCIREFQRNQERFRQSLEDLRRARDAFEVGSTEWQRLNAALEAYSEEHDANGVVVAFAPLEDDAAARTTPFEQGIPGNINYRVTFDPEQLGSRNQNAINTGHEGTHVSDFSNPLYSNPNTPLPFFSVEYRGYQTSGWVARGLGVGTYSAGGNVIWNRAWREADRHTLADRGITNYLTTRPRQPLMAPPGTPHNPWPY